VVFLTDGEYINSTQYPHNKAWLENDRYLMFESTRPRPDGKPSTGDNSNYRHVERQLLAADVKTGDIYHLATLEVEDDAKYGKYHLPMSTQYHSDYAPATNTVVYYDMSGHNLYLLDLDTGKRNLIWNVTTGTLGDPPTISDDGKMVGVYVFYPGPDEDDKLGGKTCAIYTIAIDPRKNDKAAEPYLVTSSPDPKTVIYQPGNSKYDGRPGDINLNHVVINPANKDELSFCRGYLGYSDGTVNKSRLWFAKTDGSLIKNSCVTPRDHIHTHPIWGPQGRYMYVVDIKGTGSILRVDPRTSETEYILTDTSPRCLHITTDRDENIFVYDTQGGHPKDDYGNHLENIMLYDARTKKLTRLARQMEGLNHPRHMHPLLSRDGSKVCFTVADKANSRVAVMFIEQ
jgi:Tol biopolymer transport system component